MRCAGSVDVLSFALSDSDHLCLCLWDNCRHHRHQPKTFRSFHYVILSTLCAILWIRGRCFLGELSRYFSSNPDCVSHARTCCLYLPFLDDIQQCVYYRVHLKDTLTYYFMYSCRCRVWDVKSGYWNCGSGTVQTGAHYEGVVFSPHATDAR